MVLYLNRRGIKRWLRNLREACRDQMEGYHYRYEQDAEPRRASPATAAGEQLALTACGARTKAACSPGHREGTR
ncbi:hypothetical protein Y1Q_0011136 [Alligator mississippiensis]|uniref:Trophoblast glycoprotein-like n=1 Tax=Alligator mississippiensis TaxID=8496 RepID=A0A151NMA7_ALLMI|nr:hypothetical protein Y1Q_0011136 [Alligator mississippiensis]